MFNSSFLDLEIACGVGELLPQAKSRGMHDLMAAELHKPCSRSAWLSLWLVLCCRSGEVQPVLSLCITN